MRALLVLVVLSACSVPDKELVAADAGADAQPDAPDEDPGPPETTITAAPPEFTRMGLGVFEFTASKPSATFACSIDGETPLACTSPFSRSLADGPHTFSVRATDRAGQTDDSPAEHLWSVDTIPPETTLLSGPPQLDNSTTVRFEFESPEANVHFECSLDNAAYAACESGADTGPVDNGTHTFAVRAVDRAGNVDISPAVRGWTVDTSTPDTQIISAPSGATAMTSATFAFTSPDAGSGAVFECKLDAAAFATCTSPRTVTGLADGEHTFAVRVRDAVGNIDPTPATRTWRVDRVAPDTAIDAGPTGLVATASASFAFSANEPNVTFACKLDAAAEQPCTSPATYPGLAQGAHVFAVRAIDEAGNTDASPATRSWTVDTVAPALTFTEGPAADGTSGPRVRFAFESTEGTPACSLDGAAFEACTSPLATNLAAGPHTFAVRATDAAGNAGTAMRSWTVACAAPPVGAAAGLLHLDDGSQLQPNAVPGGAPATLGPTDAVEPDDPQPVAAGRFGGALAFEAAESDRVEWPIALTDAAAVSVELWSRPAAADQDLVVTGPLALRALRNGANHVRYELSIDTGTPRTLTSAVARAGAWHHIALSVDATTARLWVDGTRTDLAIALATPVALPSLTLAGAGELDEPWLATSAFATDDAALASYCPL